MNENNPNRPQVGSEQARSESAASSSRAIERNHWSLYSTQSGWRDCANGLDHALAIALQALDDKVADGHTLIAAAFKARAWMLEVMREARNASVGAYDSEPVHRMERLIVAHVKARYGVVIDL